MAELWATLPEADGLSDGTVLLGTNGTHEWAYHPDGTPAWRGNRVPAAISTRRAW